ncbi:MAG: BolA family protein [Gammaproteobacteria bacterium]
MSERVEMIREKLQSAFTPDQLEIVDESHLHAGHAGAKDGKGHFNLLIVSDQFSGQSLIKRHKMIYEAVADLMQSDIHALSIKAKTPEELS